MFDLFEILQDELSLISIDHSPKNGLVLEFTFSINLVATGYPILIVCKTRAWFIRGLRGFKARWYRWVNHGDEREPNMFWNRERHRVMLMLIDFDRAALRPAAKRKQLSKLSRIGKKRKWEEDILEMSDLRPEP
ncbi:hypothetical protein F4823DRAFT_561422 [Ustulina deusta]|nr:hypothetical protein F4823DRAFT_561422 [Ustulina deusta]